jgi:hypothetical protein
VTTLVDQLIDGGHGWKIVRFPCIGKTGRASATVRRPHESFQQQLFRCRTR